MMGQSSSFVSSCAPESCHVVRTGPVFEDGSPCVGGRAMMPCAPGASLVGSSCASTTACPANWPDVDEVVWPGCDRSVVPGFDDVVHGVVENTQQNLFTSLNHTNKFRGTYGGRRASPALEHQRALEHAERQDQARRQAELQHARHRDEAQRWEREAVAKSERIEELRRVREEVDRLQQHESNVALTLEGKHELSTHAPMRQDESTAVAVPCLSADATDVISTCASTSVGERSCSPSDLSMHWHHVTSDDSKDNKEMNESSWQPLDTCNSSCREALSSQVCEEYHRYGKVGEEQSSSSGDGAASLPVCEPSEENGKGLKPVPETLTASERSSVSALHHISATDHAGPAPPSAQSARRAEGSRAARRSKKAVNDRPHELLLW